MKTALLATIISLWCNYGQCSVGDQSPFFQKCIGRCLDKNCLKDGLEFRMKYPRPFYLRLLQWLCQDECDYNCMWKTVELFEERKYKVPQFHGKWPFVRILGIQEPASTLFSLFNLYAHVVMLRYMAKELRPDTPLRFLWFMYGAIGCHAWIWSTIFHARDLPFTETMDYSCAFSTVLMSCYSMVYRILRKFTKVKMVTTLFFLMFFINHVAYLHQDRFDYGYNMTVNISVGLFTVICWLVWGLYNRRKMKYVWKVQIYVILVAITTLLELIDIPPILWTFDCHSIWHLFTSPLHILFYSFIIDDCKYLRNENFKYEKLSGQE